MIKQFLVFENEVNILVLVFHRVLLVDEFADLVDAQVALLVAPDQLALRPFGARLGLEL